MNKEVIEIVRELLDACPDLDENIDSEKYPFLCWFLFENIERSKQIIESVLLLDTHNCDNYFEHPIGILLRSSLHDFIIFENYKSSSTEAGDIDLVKLNDDIQGQMLAATKRFRNIKSVKEFLESCTNGDGINFKELKGFATKVRKCAEEVNNVCLQMAIDIWEYYSKYEHYSVFTRTALLNKENIVRQYGGVYHSLLNIYFSLFTLGNIGVEGIDVSWLTSLLSVKLKEYKIISEKALG